MRVLHVISDRNIGGAGILLLNLLQSLDQTRVESAVALPCDSALCPRIRALGVRVFPLQYPVDRVSSASVLELCRWIKRFAAELVHANAALSARVAGRLCGVRVLHTRHCCFPSESKPRAWRLLGGVCNRWLSDGVIATAEAAVDDLVTLGIPRDRIRVIINAATPVREVSDAELAAARRAWGIEKDDFCVGICARLVACKGHETLLRAAALVCRNDPDRRYLFLLAGEGEERVALSALARRLGIEARVRFLGFLNDPAPFYRILRINVNCSVGTETSCLAISEGMSASLPILATDYGGNPAMLGHDGAGILYPQRDHRALATAILSVAHDPALEHSMRSAAHSRYLSHFTPSRMAQQVTSFYHALLNP